MALALAFRPLASPARRRIEAQRRHRRPADPRRDVDDRPVEPVAPRVAAIVPGGVEVRRDPPVEPVPPLEAEAEIAILRLVGDPAQARAGQKARLGRPPDQPARAQMGGREHPVELVRLVFAARDVAAHAQPPAPGQRILVFAAGPDRDADAGSRFVVAAVGKRKPPDRGIQQDRPLGRSRGDIAVGRQRRADPNAPALRARIAARKRLTLSVTAAGGLPASTRSKCRRASVSSPLKKKARASSRRMRTRPGRWTSMLRKIPMASSSSASRRFSGRPRFRAAPAAATPILNTTPASTLPPRSSGRRMASALSNWPPSSTPAPLSTRRRPVRQRRGGRLFGAPGRPNGCETEREAGGRAQACGGEGGPWRPARGGGGCCSGP